MCYVTHVLEISIKGLVNLIELNFDLGMQNFELNFDLILACKIELNFDLGMYKDM